MNTIQQIPAKDAEIAESRQRFARERDRKAAKRDELHQQWLTALRIGAASGTDPFKGEASSAGLAPEDVLVYVERCNGRRNRPKGNGEYRCPEPKCTLHKPNHRATTLIINKSSNHTKKEN